MPKAMLRKVDDHGEHYECLMFVCPGCIESIGGSGLHLLPVNSQATKVPSWDWDGNLDRPTLSPSILTRYKMGETEKVCHSFLREGVFEFLNDSGHDLAGQKVPLPDLPEWVLGEEP